MAGVTFGDVTPLTASWFDHNLTSVGAGLYAGRLRTLLGKLALQNGQIVDDKVNGEEVRVFDILYELSWLRTVRPWTKNEVQGMRSGQDTIFAIPECCTRFYVRLVSKG